VERRCLAADVHISLYWRAGVPEVVVDVGVVEVGIAGGNDDGGRSAREKPRVVDPDLVADLDASTTVGSAVMSIVSPTDSNTRPT
jgi:hypothetical protein